LSFLWLAGVFLFSASFVYNILLLPFWLALISVAVGNGKAMRMAATAAALKSKVQVNDISNPISPDPTIRIRLRH